MVRVLFRPYRFLKFHADFSEDLVVPPGRRRVGFLMMIGLVILDERIVLEFNSAFSQPRDHLFDLFYTTGTMAPVPRL